MSRRYALPSLRDRGLHRCRRAQRRSGQGVRAEGARAPRRGAIEPRAFDRARHCGVGRTALGAISAAYVADSLGAQESELARQITQRRAAIRAGSDWRRPLAARLRWSGANIETPAGVIVLEALSEVSARQHLCHRAASAGNKLQIVGITSDAPSLIPLIEQSPQFTRATFYAPTTRSPSDPGERFHIEAQIEPEEHGATMTREIPSPAPHALAIHRGRALCRGGRRHAGHGLRRLSDIWSGAPLSRTSDLLDRFEAARRAARWGSSTAAEHPGTPFLEGPTVTIAGARCCSALQPPSATSAAPSSRRRSMFWAPRPRTARLASLSVARWSSRPAESAVRSGSRYAVPVRRSA